jgi:hypothetical protein
MTLPAELRAEADKLESYSHHPDETRALLHRAADALECEQLSESDKDVALAQAVEFAEYVERQAKGEMVKAAHKFLSLPYSQQIKARLTPLPATPEGG